MKSIGFMQAASYLGRGWKLVKVPGLRRFVLVPLLINILVFATLGWFAFGALLDWLANWAFFDRFGSFWLVEKLQQILQFALGIILSIALVYVFTLVANLIGAPFNSLLAERVEWHLTGKSPSADPSFVYLVKSIPKTLRSEIAKLIYLALWTIPLLIIGFIPVINIAAPILVFAFGAWMFSLEYLDYPMGNHGQFFKDIKKRLRQRLSMSLGFGSVVAIFSVIPLVNLIIMPVAVAGATALYVDHLHEETSA